MNPIIKPTCLRSRFRVLALVAIVGTGCSESPVGPAALTVASATPAADAQSVGIEATVQIQFSTDINTATVTSSSVKVETDGMLVAGTLAVDGNTVTFTPTGPLTEFNTTYTVTITTGVRGASGGRLAADAVSTFTTVFWDPAFYYRLTNLFQGPALSLDTFSDTYGCYMGDTGGFTGQFWYFTPITGSDGYHSMRNQLQGETQALEGAESPSACLLTDQPAPNQFFTGQMWKPVAFAAGYRLQNLNLGAAKSLDVIEEGDTEVYIPMMVDTGAFSGQVWFFTRLAKR